MRNYPEFPDNWRAGIWRRGGGFGYTITMSDIDFLIKRGEAFYSEGLYDSAISNYTKAIAEGDRGSQLYCLRAKAYLAKAWEAAGRAPFDEEEYDAWAADFCRRTELQLALLDAVQAVALDPANSEAYYGLGVIQIDRMCWAEAIAAFDKCLELLPGDSEAMYWRAVAFDEMGDTAKALETLGDVIAADADCSEAYYMRSQILTSKGDLDAALEDISKAIDLEPEAPEYYLQRGKVLSYMSEKPQGAGRLPEAIADLSEVLRLDPKCAEAYSWRALAYMQAGEEKKELKDLDALIALVPNHAEGYRLRYECQAACGRRLEAAMDWLYLCFLKPAAISGTMTEAGRGARADFKKFSGN
jgi:tetratricopeptide (TPR) repeat protein